VTSAGHALGMLCLINTQPRELTAGQLDTLQMLATCIVERFEACQGELGLNNQALTQCDIHVLADACVVRCWTIPNTIDALPVSVISSLSSKVSKIIVTLEIFIQQPTKLFNRKFCNKVK
jgi:hypothetical protein